MIKEKSGSSVLPTSNNKHATGTTSSGKGKSVAQVDDAVPSDADDDPPLTYGVIDRRTQIEAGEPSHKFFPSWIPVEYGPRSGRNPSSYAPYHGEEVGPFQEIVIEEPPLYQL